MKQEKLSSHFSHEAGGRKNEKERESILVRKNIEAPEHFVSVFHETKGEHISGIDEEGLQAGSEKKNMSRGRMEAGNAMFNEFIPDELKFDITRNVIFAYPFLDDGYEGMGANKRFVQKQKNILEGTYTTRKEHGQSDYLKNVLKVSNAEEYVKKMTDPKFLKSEYPGEVLEIKVDPKKCFVGDVDTIDAIIRDAIIEIGARFSGQDREHVKEYAEKYWKNMITLKDFLKWYRKPEYNESGNGYKNTDDYKNKDFINTNAYHVLAAADDTLPDYITKPEALIPTLVPQEHIRVLDDNDVPEAV